MNHILFALTTPHATWTDVALDAVKIGLGAIIGIVGSYLIAKQSHKTEIEKLRLVQRGDIKKLEFERKRQILIGCAEGCINHYNAVFNDALRISPNHNSKEAVEKWLKSWATARTGIQRFKEVGMALLPVEAQLQLLGETAALEAMSRYMDGHEISWDHSLSDESNCEKISEKLREIDKLRDAYLNEIRNAISRYD